MVDCVVGYLLCEFKICLVFRLAVHHGVAVDRPALATAPCGEATCALSAANLLDTSILLRIVEHVIRAAVRTEMVLHRDVCMGSGDIGKTLLAVLRFRRPFEQFKVHHIVGNDKEVLHVIHLAPAADHAKFRLEAQTERSSRLHKEMVIPVCLQNATRIAERAEHHEADIVVAGEL